MISRAVASRVMADFQPHPPQSSQSREPPPLAAHRSGHKGLPLSGSSSPTGDTTDTPACHCPTNASNQMGLPDRLRMVL